MALNAKQKQNKTLNAEAKIGNGFERQNWKCDEDGSERRYWEVITMTLIAEIENANRNIKLGSNDGFDRCNRECDSDGSERQNWKLMMALNAETENVTLNIKLGSDDDGSERRN